VLVKPVHAEPASGARGSTSVTAGARENGFIVTTKDNFGFLKRVLAACSVTDSAQCTASAAWASGRPTCVSVLRVVHVLNVMAFISGVTAGSMLSCPQP